MRWLPQSASADPGLTRRDDVDKRAVRCHAIDLHLEPRRAVDDAGKTRPVPGNLGADQARGEPGERALDHAGKNVVGSGRERQERYVAAALGNDAVGAIATKGNNHSRAKIAEERALREREAS